MAWGSNSLSQGHKIPTQVHREIVEAPGCVVVRYSEEPGTTSVTVSKLAGK